MDGGEAGSRRRQAGLSFEVWVGRRKSNALLAGKRAKRLTIRATGGEGQPAPLLAGKFQWNAGIKAPMTLHESPVAKACILGHAILQLLEMR